MGARARWIAWHVLRFEVFVYVSLYRWIMRRPALGAESAAPHPYVGTVTFSIWVFIVLSAIEVPIAHLLIPWEGIRFAVLILGIWGLTWMLGYYAGLRMYPHSIDDREMVIRNGPLVAVRLPWSDIETVRGNVRNYEEGRGRQVVAAHDGSRLEGPGLGVRVPADGARALALVLSNQTNVDVTLREPRVLAGPYGDPVEVVEVRMSADDPRAFVGDARARLAEVPGVD